MARIARLVVAALVMKRYREWMYGVTTVGCAGLFDHWVKVRFKLIVPPPAMFTAVPSDTRIVVVCSRICS